MVNDNFARITRTEGKRKGGRGVEAGWKKDSEDEIRGKRKV